MPPAISSFLPQKTQILHQILCQHPPLSDLAMEYSLSQTSDRDLIQQLRKREQSLKMIIPCDVDNDHSQCNTYFLYWQSDETFWQNLSKLNFWNVGRIVWFTRPERAKDDVKQTRSQSPKGPSVQVFHNNNQHWHHPDDNVKWYFIIRFQTIGSPASPWQLSWFCPITNIMTIKC